jgi:hypothetical protein
MSTPRSFFSSGKSRNSVARVLNGRRPQRNYEQSGGTHNNIMGRHNFYGPGVHLEDVVIDDGPSDNGTSGSEFDFNDSRSQRQDIDFLGSSDGHSLNATTPRRAGGDQDLISMLQQQQLLIQQVLGNQKTMKERFLMKN